MGRKRIAHDALAIKFQNLVKRANFSALGQYLN
jgi:hypothetical protein